MLFCDVTGSTALGERLDPESMRQVMSRYFGEATQVIERHGGTLEKFVGDAIMAAFGIPVLHEDDALRAVRAAAEMRDALAILNVEFERDWGVRIQVRTGVNTGEVVAGDIAGGSTFATGDTVNVAARLEQAAPPGEVLIGEATYRLVRDAVTVESVEPLAAKGKSEPLPAYRLLAVDSDAPGRARQLNSPIIGREAELGRLVEAFERTASSAACEVVTVLAPAGAGKSRLTKEFVERVEDRATVLQGRCIPYGEGITYFPLAIMLKSLAGIDDDETREEARAKLAELTADTDEGRLVATRLAGAIGLDDVLGRPEEISWAVRRLLETLAQEHPVVVVFDDIHWAEPAFLNLIEYLAAFSRGAPILILCPARPELAETVPTWATSLTNASSIVLEPLGAKQCELLVANLLGEDVARDLGAKVVAAAEGNPLFVEEMLRMLIDDGLLTKRNDRWEADVELGGAVIPPSIEALLSARLDRLAPRERAIVQRAAVIGRVFGWEAVVTPLAGFGAGRGRGEPPGADAEGARPARGGRDRRRGRVPLQPHPDPRRRLSRDPEGDPSGRPRRLRDVPRGAGRRAGGRVRRDHRLPPRAGVRAAARARSGQRRLPGVAGTRSRQALERGSASAPPRRPGGGRQSLRAGDATRRAGRRRPDGDRQPPRERPAPARPARRGRCAARAGVRAGCIAG